MLLPCLRGVTCYVNSYIFVTLKQFPWVWSVYSSWIRFDIQIYEGDANYFFFYSTMLYFIFLREALLELRKIFFNCLISNRIKWKYDFTNPIQNWMPKKIRGFNFMLVSHQAEILGVLNKLISSPSSYWFLNSVEIGCE